ncbi:MAG: 50S ribosomal protein L18 [archaeon]
MATRRRKTMEYRRKREGRTDYKGRLLMLRGGKARLVVRKSLSNISCQIVEYQAAGDKVVVAARSSELKAHGWKAANGNLPAAYLTGLLLGKKAIKAGVKEAILDLGLQNARAKGRLFATVAGARAAGLNIPVDEVVLPDEDRIKGAHIAAFAKDVKNKAQFDVVKKRGSDPSKIGEEFVATEKKINALS